MSKWCCQRAKEEMIKNPFASVLVGIKLGVLWAGGIEVGCKFCGMPWAPYNLEAEKEEPKDFDGKGEVPV